MSRTIRAILVGIRQHGLLGEDARRAIKAGRPHPAALRRAQDAAKRRESVAWKRHDAGDQAARTWADVETWNVAGFGAAMVEAQEIRGRAGRLPWDALPTDG